MSEAPVTTDDLLRTLAPWLASQRWFHQHQDAEQLTVVESFELVDPAGQARLPVLLLGDRPEPHPPWVQVPLALRPAGERERGPSFIGTVGDGRWDVFDGPGDPAFVRAWLTAASGGDDAPPVPEGVARADELDAEGARLVSGEQSNSSIVLPARDVDRTGGILKVFRGVWPGRNPDVDVPAALARIGFTHVPAPIAWLEHRWDDGFAQLGVLSAFVPGAEDGFELACAMAEHDQSFARLAGELGSVVAELHVALARALPGTRARIEAGALTAHLHDRLRWAVAAVPSLGAWEEPVTALIDQLAVLDDLPELQRIHGDLHLGQILHANDDWFVLDFEGEPLVPLPARARPDLPLRDVAGVLRSFDYAAARAGAGLSWITSARESFLEAYRVAAPGAATPTAEVVLRAFEVDKALYEVVYETQNRPAWAPIPTRALHRLVGSADETGGGRVGA